MPYYPVCRCLPAFVHRGGFPYTPTCCPPCPHSLGRVSFYSSRGHPFPSFPWAPPTADTRRCLLSCASSSYQFTMNRSASSRTPRYHVHRLFRCSGRQRGLNSEHQGGNVPLIHPWLGTPEGLRLCIYANSRTVRQVSGSPHQPSPRALPDRVTAPCFAAPRPLRKRAVIYG